MLSYFMCIHYEKTFQWVLLFFNFVTLNLLLLLFTFDLEGYVVILMSLVGTVKHEYYEHAYYEFMLIAK